MTFRKAIAVVPARMHQRHRNLFSVAGAFAFLVISPARADLVTNGGFETPITGNFTDLTAGSQPPGFGWSITSGGVDVVLAGPSSDFASAAFEGSQFLDLDGFTPGAIAQSFATIPGNSYLLSFAYANNPDGTGVPPPGCSGACATIPAQAIVSVLDSGTNAQLIAPLLITHGDLTIANPDWTTSGAIAFTAQGTATTLSFVSQDPSPSDGGIFLDAVSVSGQAAVPEPSSLVLLSAALCGLIGSRRKIFSRNYGRRRRSPTIGQAPADREPQSR